MAAAAASSSLLTAPCARTVAPSAPARAAAAARLPARPAAVPRPCRRLAARAAAASSSMAAATDAAAAIEVLRTACRTKKVPADDVMAAMQAVEAAHAQQPLVQGERGQVVWAYCQLIKQVRHSWKLQLAGR